MPAAWGGAPPAPTLYGLRNDVNVQGGYSTSGIGAAPPTGGPSYPVYVDPWGVKLASTMLGVTPPGMAGPVTGITRAVPDFFNRGSTGVPSGGSGVLNPQLLINRWCTLLDDITFTEDGVPDNSQGALNVQREGRYSWAWMFQLPTTGAAPASANESIILYERRQLLSPVGGTQLPDEHSYQATFGNPSDPSDNSVTLIWDPSIPTPAIRRGNWILDGTLAPQVHGFFYRVVDVGPVVGNGSGKLTMKLDLQTPLRAGTPTGGGVAIVIDDVVEVYYQGIN
jgi:hypothetical protein